MMKPPFFSPDMSKRQHEGHHVRFLGDELNIHAMVTWKVPWSSRRRSPGVMLSGMLLPTSATAILHTAAAAGSGSLSLTSPVSPSAPHCVGHRCESWILLDRWTYEDDAMRNPVGNPMAHGVISNLTPDIIGLAL